MASETSQILSLLRQIDSRLSRLEGKSGLGGGGAGAASGAGAPASRGAKWAVAGPAWDQYVATFLPPFQEATRALGDKKVTGIVGVLVASLDFLKGLLTAASRKGAPADGDKRQIFQALASIRLQGKPMATAAKRTDSELAVTAVFEAFTIFTWVQLDTGIVDYMTSALGSSQFHSNKILSAAKGKGAAGAKQTTWVKALNALLKGHIAFVRQHLPAGLQWKAGATACKAADVTGAKGSSGGASKPAAGVKATHAASSGAMALAAELSQGVGISKRLRKAGPRSKVKTSGLVSGGSGQRTVKPTITGVTPVFGSFGKGFRVEGQFQQTLDVPVEDLSRRTSLQIYGCERSTIRLPEGSKINNVTMTNCKHVLVVCGSIISVVQVINSARIKIQVLGRSPSLALENVDGAQVYLGAGCLGKDGTTIMTSKSSELNVLFRGMREDPDGVAPPSEDWIEKPLPEQITSKVIDGKVVSAFVEHCG